MINFINAMVKGAKALFTNKRTQQKSKSAQDKKSATPTKHVSAKDLNKELTRLEWLLCGWERLIRLTAFPFIVLSGWLTTKGLLDAKIEAHAANTENMITASMTALLAAIMIGVANILLFGLASNISREFRGRLIMLTIAIMPFVFAISTYNAILATTSERSVILSLRDRTTAWEEYVDAAMQDASGAKAAKDTLLPLKSSICTLAYGEKTGGLLTGSHGTGAVFAAYASACESVSAIIDTLDSTTQVTHERRNAASDIIAEMESIPRNTAITVYARQAEFQTQDRLLRKLVKESTSERVRDRLTIQLQVLEQSVASLGAQDGMFGRRQDQAVANLKTMLGDVASSVNGFLETESIIAKAPSQMLSVEETMLTYWRQNIPTIAIAVATDTFNFWLIAFLFTARACVEQRRHALAEAMAVQEAHPHSLPHKNTNYPQPITTS